MTNIHASHWRDERLDAIEPQPRVTIDAPPAEHWTRRAARHIAIAFMTAAIAYVGIELVVAWNDTAALIEARQ